MATAASWKPLLLRALDSNAHLKHSAFLQLATIGSNGRPSNRTVVFRGFQEDTNVIQINTDRRSAKICWYFTESWEQFRINGKIDIIDGANSDACKLQQREKAWFASSLKSRLQYLAPAPRLPDISNGSGEENQLDPSEGPVEAFCLLLFDPEQVDYLNLKSNERFIFSSRSSEQGFKLWMSEKVNP
ncbi:pyridoxine/pyridoxamine 5'-phosphate oxidase 2-like isoform X3 [Musa acuminata AAA Group]|uniref:pyridoxine/pyridoxamine 5'-phosphate oxidase 2-like isoform X3 n=1 Tax=Musa acuminata AAA Group TaxID=214697 RepID=UPI0031D874E2